MMLFALRVKYVPRGGLEGQTRYCLEADMQVPNLGSVLARRYSSRGQANDY